MSLNVVSSNVYEVFTTVGVIGSSSIRLQCSGFSSLIRLWFRQDLKAITFADSSRDASLCWSSSSRAGSDCAPDRV